MCGLFFIYKKKNIQSKERKKFKKNALKYLASRGPDGTGEICGEKYYALHTRLAITGNHPQPISKKNKIILYNGEIYNDWKKYSHNYSDADYLTNFIIKNNSSHLHKLDGEYAIIIYDKIENSLKLVSDPFATKPMYWAISGDSLVVSSYDQTLRDLNIEEKKINQIQPNSCITFDLTKNFKMKIDFPIKRFSFKSKRKSNFQNFFKYFNLAIMKRTANISKKVFVPLSSGHDSGLIAATLNYLKFPFTSYYVPFGEDKKVLEKRITLLNKNKKIKLYKITLNSYLAKKEKKFLKKNAPFLNINIDYKPFFSDDFRDIPGMISLSYICKVSRKNQNLIQLSGQGSDEIISDYYNPNTNSRRSDIKGNWSKASKPWPNFYGKWNKINLGITERIAGAHSIETRYPFLDYDLVQAYLSMPAKLKSKDYKAPINFILKKLSFPYTDIKRGFHGFKTNYNNPYNSKNS